MLLFNFFARVHCKSFFISSMVWGSCFCALFSILVPVSSAQPIQVIDFADCNATCNLEVAPQYHYRKAPASFESGKCCQRTYMDYGPRQAISIDFDYAVWNLKIEGTVEGGTLRYSQSDGRSYTVGRGYNFVASPPSPYPSSGVTHVALESTADPYKMTRIRITKVTYTTQPSAKPPLACPGF